MSSQTTMMTVSWCVLVLAVTVSSAATLNDPVEKDEMKSITLPAERKSVTLPAEMKSVTLSPKSFEDPAKRVARETESSTLGDSAKRVARESEEDESCRQMKPEHGAAKVCCELPLVFRGSPEMFKACKEELGSPPPPSAGEGRGPQPPHHGGPPHHRVKTCVAECIFNKSGLLENGKLNKDAIQKALDEYLKTDDAWKSAATAMLDKCYEAQTKDFKPDNEKFTSGSSEFLKCFSRGLFMDCIPEKWTDSEDCSKMKEKMEKCPNMMPPALFNKHP